MEASREHLLCLVAGRAPDCVPTLRRNVAVHCGEPLGAGVLFAGKAALRQLQRHGSRLGREAVVPNLPRPPGIWCASPARADGRPPEPSTGDDTLATGVVLGQPALEFSRPVAPATAAGERGSEEARRASAHPDLQLPADIAEALVECSSSGRTISSTSAAVPEGNVPCSGLSMANAACEADDAAGLGAVCDFYIGDGMMDCGCQTTNMESMRDISAQTEVIAEAVAVQTNYASATHSVGCQSDELFVTAGDFEAQVAVPQLAPVAPGLARPLPRESCGENPDSVRDLFVGKVPEKLELLAKKKKKKVKTRHKKESAGSDAAPSCAADGRADDTPDPSIPVSVREWLDRTDSDVRDLLSALDML